jgi:hypothetical protein
MFANVSVGFPRSQILTKSTASPDSGKPAKPHPEARHCYFTSNWRNIEERVDAGTTAERQFVWGVRYIDDLVLRDRSSERLYTMQDANWNVTSIANASATVQERYAYSAYGYPSYFNSSFVSRTTSSFTWDTLYCGYRYDRTPRLYCVRYRTLHPILGNWCQRNPLSYSDGASLTAASFVPNGIDPFGLIEVCNDCHPEPPMRPFLTVPPLPIVPPRQMPDPRQKWNDDISDINRLTKMINPLWEPPPIVPTIRALPPGFNPPPPKEDFLQTAKRLSFRLECLQAGMCPASFQLVIPPRSRATAGAPPAPPEPQYYFRGTTEGYSGRYGANSPSSTSPGVATAYAICAQNQFGRPGIVYIIPRSQVSLFVSSNNQHMSPLSADREVVIGLPPIMLPPLSRSVPAGTAREQLEPHFSIPQTMNSQKALNQFVNTAPNMSQEQINYFLGQNGISLGR